MRDIELYLANMEQIASAGGEHQLLDAAQKASWEMKHRLERSGWVMAPDIAWRFWQLAKYLHTHHWQTQLHWLQMAGNPALFVFLPADEGLTDIALLLDELAKHPKNLVRVWSVHLAMAIYCDRPETRAPLRPLIQSGLKMPSQAMLARARQFFKNRTAAKQQLADELKWDLLR